MKYHLPARVLEVHTKSVIEEILALCPTSLSPTTWPGLTLGAITLKITGASDLAEVDEEYKALIERLIGEMVDAGDIEAVEEVGE